MLNTSWMHSLTPFSRHLSVFPWLLFISSAALDPPGQENTAERFKLLDGSSLNFNLSAALLMKLCVGFCGNDRQKIIMFSLAYNHLKLCHLRKMIFNHSILKNTDSNSWENVLLQQKSITESNIQQHYYSFNYLAI